MSERPRQSALGSRPPLDPLLFGLVLLAISLAFQGTRGIFQPDEARYADAALAMLKSGDWLVPRLQGLVYLDKPPAIYWTIAAGIRLLGANGWGARLGSALALAATAGVVTAWASSAWGRRIGRLCGMAYVTTLLPALAATALTPDTLLVLWTATSSFAYWRWRSSQRDAERWRWALLLGVSTGIGLLTKGTATLVFLAPVVVHAFVDSGPRRILSRLELWVAALLAIAIGASWYVAVAAELPGAGRYFFDNQIAGRVWSDNYDRNPEWFGALTEYGPVLLIGGLPWAILWLRHWRPRHWRQQLSAIWRDPLQRFLAFSALLPLVVFSLAKSKLHLYILPIAPYLVMLTMVQAARTAPVAQSRWAAWSRRALLAVLLVLLIKGMATFASPHERDTRRLAESLRHSGVTEGECIDALGIKIHGLSLYGFSRATWHTIWPETYPYFEPPRLLEAELPSLMAACEGRARFVSKTKHLETAHNLLSSARLSCRTEPLSPELTLFSCASAGVSAN